MAVAPTARADRLPDRSEVTGAPTASTLNHPRRRGESGPGHMRHHRLQSARFGRIHDISPNDRAEWFTSGGLGDQGAAW
jgi:hypothetical protein